MTMDDKADPVTGQLFEFRTPICNQKRVIVNMEKNEIIDIEIPARNLHACLSYIRINRYSPQRTMGLLEKRKAAGRSL